MPRLHWAIWGKKEGNFRPSQVSEEELSKTLSVCAADHPRVRRIVAPRCNWTTDIASVFDRCFGDPPFYEQANFDCDGVVHNETGFAIALFNADCPLIAIHDIRDGRLAVLHGGYRCLLREDGGDSIIKVLFKKFAYHPKFVEAFVGFGIGNCCFGAEHLAEMKDSKVRGKLPIATATKGPRKGQRSVDVRLIALQQLSELGVPLKAITVDLTCTACAEGGKKYHSNCWDGPNAGRNCALAWLEE